MVRKEQIKDGVNTVRTSILRAVGPHEPPPRTENEYHDILMETAGDPWGPSHSLVVAIEAINFLAKQGGSPAINSVDVGVFLYFVSVISAKSVENFATSSIRVMPLKDFPLEGGEVMDGQARHPLFANLLKT